jgi:hypothetical protein
VAESVSCFCEVLARCRPPQEEQKLEESAISLPQWMQNMKSPPEDGQSKGISRFEPPVSTMPFYRCVAEECHRLRIFRDSRH